MKDDIARLREDHRLLQESEARYRELVEGTIDLIAHTDENGNYNFVNHMAEKILGFSPKECIGKSAFKFVHPDDKEWTQHWFNECAEQKLKQSSIENRLVHTKTGKVFNLAWSVTFHYDNSGSILGVGWIARDVAEIRSAEHKYQLLFQKMLDGFSLHEIICNDSGIPVDYRFLSVNPAFERITGIKAENLIGKTVLEVLPGTEKNWIDTFGKVALTGESITFQNESVELGKHFEVTAYSPKKGQFVCVSHDITKRLKAEEERIDLEAKLRHTQKIEAIGTLSAGIAHDFNNFLTTILGYSGIALDDIPEGNPAHLKIKEVLNAGNRAKEVVAQILTYSRKTEQKLAPVEVHTLIKEALVFLRASTSANIEIEQKIASDCGNILADPTQIFQVLINIFLNATQAMEEKGGILRIELNEIEQAREELSNDAKKSPRSYVQLIVSDTGVGIEKENLERVFDPYFTTKKVGKGSGLGLSVVHGIVHSHNGFIKIDSRQGQGTELRLSFPKIEQRITQQTLKQSFIQGGDERILVVDDEPTIVMILGMILEKLGYIAVTMESSVKALELFRSDPNAFDLVITDYSMPHMTGAQMIKEMIPIRPNIPIIMCSAYGFNIDIDQADRARICAFVEKPVKNIVLAEAVRKALDAKIL